MILTAGLSNLNSATQPRSHMDQHWPSTTVILFFWKAYLSIKQPLTAHDPIHPQVPSRHFKVQFRG
jgi:hypothetical protein